MVMILFVPYDHVVDVDIYVLPNECGKNLVHQPLYRWQKSSLGQKTWHHIKRALGLAMNIVFFLIVLTYGYLMVPGEGFHEA